MNREPKDQEKANSKMPIEVTDLTEADIPAAIEIIQTAFAEDPYFKWVFDAENVSPSVTDKHTQTR